MERKYLWWAVPLAAVALAFVSLLGFRVLCVNFVDNYELAYKYSTRTGQIERLNRTGYFVTKPLLEKVHSVDLRPMQVCINANARVLNCKLVQFNPDDLEIFLQWHGRNNYNGDAGSTNQGGQTMGNLNQILMSYAFDGSGKTYPFLKVLRELKPEDAMPQNQAR